MSSPVISETKGPTFSSADPNPTVQDEEPQQQLKEDQNPNKSPNSITLEIPDAVAVDPNTDDAEEITPSSPAVSDFRESSSTFSLPLSSRVGGGGGKRRKRNALQEKKYLKRCESLAASLNLIPFVPVKSLDLSSHEELLRRLGLWDFAHLDFDFKLRRDLILQLIANFSPTLRYSKVNEVRIKVTRPDLGRALCLPVKKGKAESASEEESKESVSFVEEFVSNFILLHDDTWMMSDDVMSTMKLIRDGNFEKVDFAGLIWTMVEKELNNTELGDCYYASHLQLLIKSQKAGLLEEEEPNKMEIDLKEEDQEVEAEEEESVKMSQEPHGKPDLKEQNIELSLGGLDNTVEDDGVKENQEQLNNEEDAMDFEESKDVEVEQRQWYSNNMDGHLLQQCNLGGVGSAEFEAVKQEEEEEDDDDDDDREDEEEEEENDEEDEKEGEYEEKEEEEDEMAFGISPKGFALEGTDSENLIEAIEASQNPFSSPLQSRNFFAPKVDNMPGGSGLFNNGNGSKRAIGDFDDEMPHQSSLNGGNKRMRSDDHWDNMKSASEHDIYMNQIQHILGKARMLHNAKDQELQNLSMQNQMLLNELENQANIYQHNLAKAKMEEHHKRQVEVYRYEHELHMMGKLLEGYRKALKDTTRAFAEYRKKVSSMEEPIYKDAGSGGLVLSTSDMEKLRLKLEEEERQTRSLIERMINEFEAGWVAKLEEFKTAVDIMSNRILDAEKGVNFCKEKVERSKGSRVSDSAPSEEQGAQTTV